MYIYTSRKGEKQGPFTIYRITEMIDAGDLSLDDPAWHEGLDGWRPIKDIQLIASALDSLKKREPRLDGRTEDKTNVAVFPYWKHLESEKKNIPDSSEEKTEDERLPASPFRFKPPLPLPSTDPDDNKESNSPRMVSVHPFLRFWARFFDYLLLNLFVWFVFEPPQIPIAPGDMDNLIDFLRHLNELIPQEEQIRIATIQGASLFAWNFIEALLLSSFGTTPGKLLFNIKVHRKDGGRLNYMEAMNRSMIVWILGIGIGLAFFQILAMTIALFYLLRKGETLWDRLLGNQVHHRPLGPQKIILAVAAYLVLLSLQGLFLS
jgi:uncharacterized RDD family membrane protein YckC